MAGIYTWDLIHDAVKKFEMQTNIHITSSGWQIFKDAETEIRERNSVDTMIQIAQFAEFRKRAENAEEDSRKLANALADLEHAVNKNISGMKVDIGEWLKLISAAQEALGERVIE